MPIGRRNLLAGMTALSAVSGGLRDFAQLSTGQQSRQQLQSAPYAPGGEGAAGRRGLIAMHSDLLPLGNG
jgi:hypothetical protein